MEKNNGIIFIYVILFFYLCYNYYYYLCLFFRFLYEPSDTFYSSKSSKEFITYDVKAKQALQCTQYAGDLMYVPGSW
jgi:hypothetical protein